MNFKFPYKNGQNTFLTSSAHALFAIIFIAVGLNSIFNSISLALGAHFPKTTFLFTPDDLFADYFKFIFSYPHEFSLRLSGSSALLNSYINSNPYSGLSGLTEQTLTHFHVTPLTTLISLACLNLMQFLDPRVLYLFLILIIFVTAYLFIKYYIARKADKLFIFISFLISYPTLFFITRGNIFAGLAAFSLIAYFILLHRNERFFIALLLLAIAVNIRPNAIIFIFGLLIPRNSPKIRTIGFVYFVCVSSLIFFSSLLVSSRIYPDYTFRHFIDGLEIYHTLYVLQNGGLAYGSSLLGLFKVVFGYVHYSEFIISLIGTLTLLYATLGLIKKNLSHVSYVFILCAIYTLCSSVFADYHLIIFFAPIMLIYLEETPPFVVSSFFVKKDNCLIFLSSVFQLIPKNYIFHHGVSLQVLLNPIILFIAVILLLSNKNFYKELISD